MDQSSILIIGARGQLGTALRETYPRAKAVDTDELDITDEKQLDNFDFTPIKVIVNAAAYTNVDGAETEEGLKKAWLVNGVGTANLSRIAIKHGLLFVHVSTDYVFDGKQNPHTEDENFSPLNVYGQTKAAADLLVGLIPKHYIIRTSWVIGEGHNFVRTMVDIGQKGVSPEVVNDQIGRLTFTKELVRVVEHLLKSEPDYGTYNVTNGGQPASWAEITRKIFSIAGFNLEVSNISTADYYKDKPESAKRPLNSYLDLSKLESTGFRSIDWETDLKEYVKKELSL